MDFAGKVVIHKTWGPGTVTRYDPTGLYVSFNGEEKRFSYPDSFEGFLRFEEPDLQETVSRILQEKHESKQRALAAYRPITVPVQKQHATPKRAKAISEKNNIAFKCNYCDGGANERHIGYRGPCSERMIRYNVDVAQHTWCVAEECPCRQLLEREIDTFQLEQLYLDGGMVCYESRMLEDWAAFAGIVLKGEKKNEPNKIRNIHYNSLSVLTTRMPYSPEEDRFVFGVFLVGDADEGDARDAGFVKCTSEYRIELSPKEAAKIKFWNYHANDIHPDKASWGQGLYRYTSDIEAAQILKDIVQIKEDPSEKAFALSFLTHFCRIKGLNLNEIPTPNGALKRK